MRAGWVALLALFMLGAAFAPWIATHDPYALDAAARLRPPSATHLLGTDLLGRDVFSRMVYGSRTSLTVAVVGVLASATLGVMLGAAAALGPRWVDPAALVLIDGARSLPVLLLAMAVVAAVGAGMVTLLCVVVFSSTPTFARFARTQVMVLRSADFVLAERLIGHGPVIVFLRHILPNIAGPILVLAAMEAPAIVGLEAGLSFLGLGVPVGSPSWGAIASEGFRFLERAPWLIWAGTVPVALITLAFTFSGEALGQRLDPRRKVLL